MNWQPIETAPKDGTRVLLAVGTYTGIGYFIDSVTFEYGHEKRRTQEWAWSGYSFLSGERPQPTHWMPLPLAPAATEQEAA